MMVTMRLLTHTTKDMAKPLPSGRSEKNVIGKESVVEMNGSNMKVGDLVRVEYNTNESFGGEVRKIRTMPNGRVLFMVDDMDVGYRSMYVDKCVSIEVVTPESFV